MSQYFKTGIWTGELAGQATSDSTHVMYWDLSTSSPITDIRHAKTQARLNAGGFVPNIGVFSRPVFDKLVDHPDFIDRTKYGQTAPNPAMATRRIIAEILELEEVLVMDAVYNTAAEGATESNSYIGGLSAGLFYRPKNAGLMVPSAGYTFNWTGMIGQTGGAGLRIKTFRMEHLNFRPGRNRLGLRHGAGFEGLRLLLQRRHLGGVTMFLRKLSWAQLTKDGIPPLFVLRPLAGGFTPPNLGDEYPAPNPADKLRSCAAARCTTSGASPRGRKWRSLSPNRGCLRCPPRLFIVRRRRGKGRKANGPRRESTHVRAGIPESGPETAIEGALPIAPEVVHLDGANGDRRCAEHRAWSGRHCPRAC